MPLRDPPCLIPREQPTAARPRARTVKSSLTKPTQVVNQSESSELGMGHCVEGMGHRVERRSPTPFADVSAAFLPGLRHHTPTAYRGLAIRARRRFGRSDSFFAGQHVALDLSAVNLSSNAIGQLVANLEERSIRVLGIEGVDPAKWQPGLPPVLRSDRVSRNSEAPAAPSPSCGAPAHPKAATSVTNH